VFREAQWVSLATVLATGLFPLSFWLFERVRRRRFRPR
jgi:hypothetical protein